MTRLKISDSRVCYACGKNLRKSELGYHPSSFKSYCKLGCGEGHPNYPQKTVELIPSNGVRFGGFIESKFEGETLEHLKSALNAPKSFRATPPIVMHIMKYAQVHDTESFNATIKEILEEHMRKNPLDDVELDGVPWDYNYKGGFRFREKEEKEIKEEKIDSSTMFEVLEALYKSSQEQAPIKEEPEPEVEAVEEIKPQIVESEPKPVEEDEEEMFLL